MDILSIIIIGIGLAMDCFAVSISKGMHVKKHYFWMTFRMALLFGFFQGLMPLIGYSLGVGFAGYMKAFDHWVAFGLLALIGGKMLIEGLKYKDPDSDETPNPFKWSLLLSLALATSIDALATGIVFIPYSDLIWIAIAIIGIISFIFTFIGMYIGVHFGKRFHVKVEALGGIILIGIGIKILIEHLVS
jgi:manganese efflux pump family protein